MEKKEYKLNTTVEVILGIILSIFVIGIISLFTYAIRKMFKILKRERVIMIGDHLEEVKQKVPTNKKKPLN
jgi:hypothetical protein